ncbi:MAG: DUF86 domain-containing protein [Deltaproteobacteria bacterium]|nr:DUF86 domain-containing protein [Deltaproteobacteria bacterium]
MVDQAIVIKKVGLLRGYVTDVRGRLPIDAAAFVADADLHDLVAFHLLLAVQSAIDIATHLIASEGLGVPSSYREAFESLASRQIVDHGLATRVAEAAALRNRLAHAYGSVDWHKLHAEAPGHLAALEEYAARVAAATGLPP